jgi:hypothetical protein
MSAFSSDTPAVANALPPLPAGPWKSRHEVEAIIGPVHRVLAPRWGHQAPVYAAVISLCLLAVLALALVLLSTAWHAGFIRLGRNTEWLVCPTFVLAGFTIAGFFVMWHPFRLLSSRLLVGEGGLVEWTPAGGTLLTADDLGVNWVVHVPDRRNDGIRYAILLALRHVPSGTRIYITDFYADAATIAQLLREKLANRAPGRWSEVARRKSRPARTEGTQITQTGPGETPTTEEPADPLSVELPSGNDLHLDPEAVSVLGRLEAVSNLRAEGRRLLEAQARVWSRLLVLCVVAGVLVCEILWLPRWWKSRLWLVSFVPLLLGLVIWTCAYIVGIRDGFLSWLDTRLLIGDKGWGLWRRRGVEVYPYAFVPDAWQKTWLISNPPKWSDYWLPRWWLGYAKVYEQGLLLEEHFREELRRRQERRERPDSAPSLPPGPWLLSAAAQEIGPVELVAEPTPNAQQKIERWQWVWSSLRQGIVAFILLVVGLQISGLLPLSDVIVLASLGGGTWLALRCNRRYQNTLQREALLHSRLLLGSRGLAFWSSAGSIVLLWEDLGREWTATPKVSDKERRAEWYPVRLKLRSSSGQEILLTDFYEGAAHIEERILAELQRNASCPIPRLLSTDITLPDPGLRPEAN